MNILHLTTHLNAGGITSYLYLLGQRLRRERHNVFIVSSGGEDLSKFSECGIQHKIMNIRTKSELDPRIYIAAWQLKEYVRTNKIDVIHAHTRITQVMGQLLSVWTKRRYLSTCHGYFKTRFIRRIAPCWGGTVIAISIAVVKHLHEDFHVPQDKIAMIHNGIDIRQFPFIEEKMKVDRRKEYHLSGEGPIIGIIARLSTVKGHDVLIQAMKKVVADFPTAKLLIVGQGKEEPRLRELTQTLDLKSRIIFLPSSGKPEQILPLFDIFVLPSYNEGLALSLIEAQASGLPVVATRVGGIPEVVLHEKTGILIEPGDVDGLAGSIIALLKNREYARSIGEAAHAFVVMEFNADRMAKDTIKVYEKILSGR